MKTDIGTTINEFLQEQQLMSEKPRTSNASTIEGEYKFALILNNLEPIVDSYFLRIKITEYFPKELPIVFEIGNKIPKELEFHINPKSYSLCLGAHFELHKILAEQPSLKYFAKRAIEPYLYAVSYKLKNGGSFICGELPHYTKGLILNYKEEFKLKTSGQVIQALALLTCKPRIANKKRCPCGCGRRLGLCDFRIKLNCSRRIASKQFFIGEIKSIEEFYSERLENIKKKSHTKYKNILKKITDNKGKFWLDIKSPVSCRQKSFLKKQINRFNSKKI